MSSVLRKPDAPPHGMLVDFTSLRYKATVQVSEILFILVELEDGLN